MNVMDYAPGSIIGSPKNKDKSGSQKIVSSRAVSSRNEEYKRPVSKFAGERFSKFFFLDSKF